MLRQNNLQKLFLRVVVARFFVGHSFCLTPAAHAAWLEYVFLLVELPGLAALHAWAYPVKELLHAGANDARKPFARAGEANAPPKHAPSKPKPRAGPPAVKPISEGGAQEAARANDTRDAKQSMPEEAGRDDAGEAGTAATTKEREPRTALLAAGAEASDAV